MKTTGIIATLSVAAMLFWSQESGAALKGRIAFSHDGNRHDIDNWAASTANLLLLHKAGLKQRMVHLLPCPANGLAGSHSLSGCSAAFIYPSRNWIPRVLEIIHR